MTGSQSNVRIGDPTTHRRLLGPLAARGFDARLAQLHVDGVDWRPLDALDGEGDATYETIVAVGALCAAADVDAAVAAVRRVLAPDGRLLFLEHVGRTRLRGRLHRLVDPLWASVPMGCHVDHDVPGALRRGGLLVTDLERTNLPSVIPLLRLWVQGVARSPA